MMSVLWMDDPSFYTTAQTGVRYDSTGAAVQVSAGNGRFGTASFRVSGTQQSWWKKNTGTNTVTGVQAFSFRLSGTPNAETVLLTFYDSGSIQVDLRITTGSSLRVTRAGTQLA